MWKKEIKITVESTTYCNAKCPQCSRTNSTYGTNENPLDVGKVPWLPLNSWSLKEFKHMFSDETLEAIDLVHFSGTYGDPGMNPDLLDMVKYLDSKNVKATVNSNGSMRDENFWYELAGYANSITFDIDGINQEMHSKYRRNTNLKKILANMQAAIDIGISKIKVFTVIFKHNEEYVNDIKKMVMDMGVREEHFTFMESNRFSNSSKKAFINEKGDVEYLEQTLKPAFLRDRTTLTRKIRDHRDTAHLKKDVGIVCMAEENNNLHVSNTGLVFPCCYLASPIEKDSYASSSDPNLEHPMMKYIKDNSLLFNLKFTSLPEILNNDWYKSQLKDSFTSNPIFNCKKMCGECK